MHKYYQRFAQMLHPISVLSRHIMINQNMIVIGGRHVQGSKGGWLHTNELAHITMDAILYDCNVILRNN
jgi:hypothetical protein